MLRDKINNSMKEAMKSGDKLRLSTVRLINAAIKNAEIEARTSNKTIDDEALMGLMQKMIKQRQELVELYDKGGRKELADQERGEIKIIQEFLPAQMSDADVNAAIAAAIKESGAADMKDMGKVIAVLKGKYAGQMDFGKASGMVKAALSK